MNIYIYIIYVAYILDNTVLKMAAGVYKCILVQISVA
jgi:hypothetical protein